MGKHIFSILVNNKPGVMTRVSSMFTRRGFNIDTLTVGETESPEFSRMTVSMIGDDYAKDQVVKQLSKLHDVKQVQVMERDDTVTRELLLIKVKNDSSTRQDVLAAVDVFRSKIVDYSPDALCIEITGETTKLNAFIELVKPFGIMEICRTGIVALERGSHCLRSSD
ncbi:MAG: acetolactate synthase small subunit [Oscillospiraceae bacterium]|nr:acetolactate synthase small subunit [Oscillospiraceae bacterium]MBP1591448.1 acetolactate synthase small subunit [Oscillospiraceae bacterium]MBR3024846.1 acetolactate synthase small subunit [Oscillospiraceae bacterium]